jgi:glutamine amidotransferase
MFAEARDAHLFREAAPAADSALAKMVVDREIPCRQLMAHVRRASHGKPLLANTHPFSRVRHGRTHAFAHNGTLHGIENLAEAKRLLGQRVGNTDSELAFLILLGRLDALESQDDEQTRFDCFADFAAEMRELGDANFLFFDGQALHAHADRRIFETPDGLTPPREPGLVMRRFHRLAAPEDWHAIGAHIRDIHPQTVLFASVPLNDEGWEPLPRGTTLAVRDGQIIAEIRA